MIPERNLSKRIVYALRFFVFSNLLPNRYLNYSVRLELVISTVRQEDWFIGRGALATAKDVAKRAGTSTAVVSYVFNNGPRPVRKETKDKVLAAALELSYKPNASARALTIGKSFSLGLLIPSIQNPFFGELSHAIEIKAKESGYLLLIADSAMDPLQEKRQLEGLVERRVDGIILVSCASTIDVDIAKSNGIPVVALHPVSKSSGIKTVHMNYKKAAFTLASHLIQSHRIASLLALMPNVEKGGARDHIKGIEAALSESANEVVLNELRSDVSRSSASHELTRYLQNNELPEAIYCSTDEQAFGVLSALSKMKIQVPKHVKVVGFDGTKHSEFSIPALTTMGQPLLTIADQSVEALLADSGQKVNIGNLDGHLIVRQSCGC